MRRHAERRRLVERAKELRGGFSTVASRIVLLWVACIYGSMDVTMRIIFTLRHPPSSTSVGLVKAVLCTLLFAPALLVRWARKRRRPAAAAAAAPPPLWPVACRLAFFNAFSQELVLAGIARTSAAKAAFLLQLSVIWTPIFERLILKRRQGTGVWIGAAIALGGVAALAVPGGGAAQSAAAAADARAAAVGDGLVVLGAATWGWYLCLMSAVPRELDATSVQAAKNLAASGVYLAFWAASSCLQREDAADVFAGWGSPAPWLLVFYCASIPGALADVLQQRAQAAIRASEACMILASEPLWAAVLSLPLLGEELAPVALAGGGLVLLGAVVSSGAVPCLPPAGRLRVPSVASSMFSPAPPTPRSEFARLAVQPGHSPFGGPSATTSPLAF